MRTIIVWIVLILSSGPLSVQSISKIMRNSLKCQTDQQNTRKDRAELGEARTAGSELKPAETLSYTELRDFITSHLSETKEGDIVMGQCDGLGSEWVDISSK